MNAEYWGQAPWAHNPNQETTLPPKGWVLNPAAVNKGAEILKLDKKQGPVLLALT